MKALSTLWHTSHKVVGRVTNGSSGPNGMERCSRCGAHRWARPENYSEDCGGSIDYDTNIKHPCAAILAANPTAKPDGGGGK